MSLVNRATTPSVSGGETVDVLATGDAPVGGVVWGASVAVQPANAAISTREVRTLVSITD
ncbi:hypothetical protein D2E62_03590 [Mycobacteroides abscessus]|nr:hypothetical protein D2E62_03590 [Mycobacteroides abscessus]